MTLFNCISDKSFNQLLTARKNILSTVHHGTKRVDFNTVGLQRPVCVVPVVAASKQRVEVEVVVERKTPKGHTIRRTHSHMEEHVVVSTGLVR